MSPVSPFGSAAALFAIYDTVTDPSRWHRALDVVADAIGAVGGGLYVRRLTDRPFDFSAASSIYDRMSHERYLSEFARHEQKQWEYLNRQPPLALVLDDQTGVPRAELDARPDYVYSRETCGIGRRVAVRLNEIPTWYDAAIFAFDARIGEVPAASLRTLDPLLPHLAKAVEAGRTFAILRARYNAALAVLDRVQAGLAIALPSGEVLLHNAEAARIFGEEDGLSLGRDRHLSCHNPEKRHKIEAGIRLSACAPRGSADRPEFLEVIERHSGKHPWVVEISPLAESGGEIDTDLVGALITIVDPDTIDEPDVRRLAALHGLTAAESEVCVLLVAGASRQEIAERRNTSAETVKAQVGAIFSKTDTHARSDLDLSPGIRAIASWNLPPLDRRGGRP